MVECDLEWEIMKERVCVWELLSEMRKWVSTYIYACMLIYVLISACMVYIYIHDICIYKHIPGLHPFILAEVKDILISIYI